VTHRRRFSWEKLPASQAIELICAPEHPHGPHYYLLQQNLLRDYPELSENLTPPLLEVRPLFAGLWCGGAGNVTPLHYDEPSNLFIQCHGRKVFRLFPPEDHEALYPTPGLTDPFLSYVDITKPDYRRFPLFRQARAVEVLLDPGDALYLPPCWWHTVRSIDTALSVNFWWPPSFIDLLKAPAVHRVLGGLYSQERLKRYRAAFYDNPRDGFVGLAATALEHGEPRIAALCAGAALSALAVRWRDAGVVEVDRSIELTEALRLAELVAGSGCSPSADAVQALIRHARALEDRFPEAREEWTVASSVVGT
jgi:hypothetical protein